jgi:hypothetical protein
MVVMKSAFYRLLAVLVIMASAIISKNAMIFFSVFLPTLIHVYVFTGLFMLYGAMKGRSKSGYLPCLVFVLIPLLFVFIHPESGISEWARRDYSKFEGLNLYILNLWDSNIYSLPVTTQSGFETMINGIYQSKVGVAFMRFIAFAYTYHYLRFRSSEWV